MSTAEPKLRFGQQAALHTERISDRSSSSATMSDQDFAEELSGTLLGFKRLLELLLRDQAHLDQDLTQETPRLLRGTHHSADTVRHRGRRT